MNTERKENTQVWNETPEQYNRRTGRIVKDVLTVQSNNPGAIFWFGDKWQGLDTKKSVNGKICYFDDVASGVRAHVITLLSYQRKHGLMNPASIINRYAPSGVHGNNPDNYVKFVCEMLGINSTFFVNFDTDPVILAKFAYAMHIVEAGFSWVKYGDYLSRAKTESLVLS